VQIEIVARAARIMLIAVALCATPSFHAQSQPANGAKPKAVSSAQASQTTVTKAAGKSAAPAAAAADKCETCHAAIANTKESDTRHPAMETGCDSCHTSHALPKPGKVDTPKFLKKSVPDLCGDCHDLKERSALRFQHAVANDCTTCHNPHSSPNPKMLTDKQPALCESCHSNQAEAHQKDKFLHKPAFETGCSTCHDPHASANEHQLRVQGNALCLSCHAQNAAGENGSNDKTLVLFGGKTQLPGDYLKSIRRVALNGGQTKGHPTANHPVAGVNDPKTKQPIACTTCHSPHSSANSPQLFVTGKRSSSQLCIRCH
jgi:predicted CXXCH cytochrome family protein